MKLERELGGLRGRKIAVLGLAFKPNTDDIRDAPAINVIRRLVDRGASVQAYDPIANDAARAAIGGETAFCEDMYAALEGADALLLATEWNEFRALDFARCARAMRGDLVVDGRNIFDPEKVLASGLRYAGVGRNGRTRAAAPGAAEAGVTRRATRT
jgi:UDPglucose 6-dehydrogenase